MAQKRMFDRAIIDTDKFMDLPMSAKALYFLLGMEADDEGFVSFKKVLRIHGGNEDDIKVLITKNFLIVFESGVVVITDWQKNNYLDKNRLKPTEYILEKEQLTTKSGKYIINKDVKPMLNRCSTRVVESSVVESNIGKASLPKPLKVEAPFNSTDYIKEMLTDKGKHIQLIGKYFITSKSKFPSKLAIQGEIKRWVRDARLIVEYSDEQINKTFQYVNSKFPDEWNLSTIKKYISKI